VSSRPITKAVPARARDHRSKQQPTRPKIKNRTAHLGITIRRGKNQDKTDTVPVGTVRAVVDLEGTV
jgi:hypothetical protein